MADSPPLEIRGIRGVTNENVVRGFSLVRHDPERVALRDLECGRMADSPPLRIRGARGVTNENVVRGFSLVQQDPEGSHYETWSAAGRQIVPLLR
jgi:hypothetical protein